MQGDSCLKQETTPKKKKKISKGTELLIPSAVFPKQLLLDEVSSTKIAAASVYLFLPFSACLNLALAYFLLTIVCKQLLSISVKSVP